MVQLPVFEGWTVDLRLREFRRGDEETGMEFVAFESDKGLDLLARYAEQLDDSAEEKALIEAVM